MVAGVRFKLTTFELNLMLGGLGSTAQGLRVRSFLHGFVGDVKIEDMLAGLDSSKEMLVARVKEGNSGMVMDSGFHFA